MNFIAKYYVTLSLAVAQLAVSAWLYFGVIRPIQLETATLSARAAALDAEISVRRKNSDARVQWWVQRMIADSLYADSIEVRLKTLERLVVKPKKQVDTVSHAELFSLFQVNGLDVPDILKYSVGIILALAGVVGWQARQMVKMNKEHRDDLKGFTKDYREDSKESVAVMKSLEIAVHGMSERIK